MKLNNYNRWILSSVAVLALTACGGSSNNDNNNSGGGSDDIPAKPTKNSIIHNGTVYGTVVSPITGRVWLDRNLGADRVCTAYNDAQCFGDYYQWGRGYDGHQDPHSDTSSTRVSDINNPHHMFVLNPTWFLYENVTLRNATLENTYKINWERRAEIDAKLIARWRATDGTGICPAGFYVPSHNDMFAENDTVSDTYNYDFQYNTAAFRSFLKLPSSGVREFDRGTISDIGHLVSLWLSSSYSSLIITKDTRFSVIDESSGTALGLSIRCIKVK